MSSSSSCVNDMMTYQPALIAVHQMTQVTVWLPLTAAASLVSLYRQFVRRLHPMAVVDMVQLSIDDVPYRLQPAIDPSNLHFVSAALIPAWPLSLPFLPLPELVGEPPVSDSSQDQETSPLNAGEAIGIIFFGPESTGKSTLSTWLSSTLAVPLAPEYVRLWFDLFGSNCNEEAALVIAQVVGAFQQSLALACGSHWLADTDVLASWMWFEWYFGYLPEHLDLPALATGKVYLLMWDDLPFMPDHQRRYADRREFDATYAEQFLRKSQARFVRVTGEGRLRQSAVEEGLRQLLSRQVS